MENLIDLIPFSFVWPLAFIALPLPWLIKQKVSIADGSISAPKMPLFYTFKSLGIGSGTTQEKNPPWQTVILAFCWILLVTALSRPTYYGAAIEVPLNGRDLMLAIDISPSMKEQDLTLNNQTVTRLDVVKDVVSSFIEERKGDRVGLILFGSEPYIQSPLTFDTTTVHTLLDEAYLGMAGQATAIGDAIALGVKRLRNRPENSRVLILMSDGANTAGEIPPEKAAQLAAQENIKIYTIGIGADEMLKRTLFITQRVNPSADLDEKMLTEIALTTNGQYFRARDTKSLQNIYEQINKLEPIELDNKTYRPSKALFFWFLSVATTLYLVLFLHKTLLKSTLYPKLFSGINQKINETR
ncbi:MAG: Ca-activated chloride channel family protein [Oleiphilaceae bacterium]|jgi:Ca-activated chloride channel family protein